MSKKDAIIADLEDTIKYVEAATNKIITQANATKTLLDELYMDLRRLEKDNG